MERNELHRQLANMKKSLLDQGYLDERFVLLEELQDADEPNFQEAFVTLFYRNSPQTIQDIEQELEKNPLDFAKLDEYMDPFMYNCSNIGAKKVKSECIQFRDYCKAENTEGCRRSFQQLKEELEALKKKLEAYFQFARQIGPLETACRPK